MDKTDSGRIDSIIIKYLLAEISREELLILESWVKESPENEKYFRQQKNVWATAGDVTIDTDKALSRVSGKIGKEAGNTGWLVWQKLAAIFLIPLLLAGLWYHFSSKSGLMHQKEKLNTAAAAFGTFTSLELPDGSKVWLNAGSTLQYPDHFNSSNRTVYLSGEAYFEVHSDIRSPFLVKTNYFIVKATGTRFNVMSYKNCQNPSVTLVEGKVDIREKNSGQKDRLISTLLPHQHLVFDTLNKQVKIETEDPYKHIAWKDGKLVFRNDLLGEVTKRISLQYNVDIVLVGAEIQKYRYRATFENEPLDELLRLLKLSSPIDYREESPKLQPDGSFSKRKIIIFQTAL
jgi:transmembrane sensor